MGYDDYCLICGCPLDDENFKWTKRMMGITMTNKIVRLRECGDGTCYTQNDRMFLTLNMGSAIHDKNDDLNEVGFVCHSICYKLLYDNLKIKLLATDFFNNNKYNFTSLFFKLLGLIGKQMGKYQPQYFDEIEIIPAKDKYLFENPETNVNNRKRIISIWKILKPKIIDSAKYANTPSKNISSREKRPSPSESATLFKVGTIKTGNDGNKWIIVENNNGVKRWQKYKIINKQKSRKNKRKSRKSKRKSKRKLRKRIL